VRDLRNLHAELKDLTVSLEFTQLGGAPCRATVVWSVFAPERGIDIAGLELDEPVQSATTLSLALDSAISQGAEWRSFGYPQTVAMAQWIDGTTSGLLTEGNRSVLALRSAQAREVLKGLSGAPVLTGDRVIGVLSEQLLQKNSLGQVVPAFDVAYAVAIGRALEDPEVQRAIQAAGVSLDVATSDPAARRSLAVLDAAGNPFRVGQVADLALFGVRRARNDIDTHGNEYFPYVARDVDVAIRDMLDELAIGKTQKMLLLVGESTAGK
jgi:hypothetical protein